MKTKWITLAAVLMIALALPTLCLAAEVDYDTLADWDIRIAVPEGIVAVLDGGDDCYYLYADEDGSIPYVLVTVYNYDDLEEFIDDFTDYMRSGYDDLEVTAEAEPATVGDKEGVEIDYGYTVSGYEVVDRRIVIPAGGRMYMFASKEVPELDLSVGGLLEDTVADSVFLFEEPEPEPEPGTEEGFLADAYLYCLPDGMPKYWLDFTGAITDNLVLHCYFRSSDPTFYESIFVLDLNTADIGEDHIDIYEVQNQQGMDVSNWFETLTLELAGDRIVMTVERDESTLAGGSEDNVLTGEYVMEPMGVGTVYEYFQDDGQLKYWMSVEPGEIELHGMFREGDSDYYEDVYHLSLDTAEYDGEYTFVIHDVADDAGRDVSDQFESLSFTEVQGAVIMDVERDERTLAGGEDSGIMTGVYMLEPRTYLTSLAEGPYAPEELGEMAQRYYMVNHGFFPPETEVEPNGDGAYTIHLFEIVDLDGITHTATSAWYTVDDMGRGHDDITGQEIRLAG